MKYVTDLTALFVDDYFCLLCLQQHSSSGLSVGMYWLIGLYSLPCRPWQKDWQRMPTTCGPREREKNWIPLVIAFICDSDTLTVYHTVSNILWINVSNILFITLSPIYCGSVTDTVCHNVSSILWISDWHTVTMSPIYWHTVTMSPIYCGSVTDTLFVTMSPIYYGSVTDTLSQCLQHIVDQWLQHTDCLSHCLQYITHQYNTPFITLYPKYYGSVTPTHCLSQCLQYIVDQWLQHTDCLSHYLQDIADLWLQYTVDQQLQRIVDYLSKALTVD